MVNDPEKKCFFYIFIWWKKSEQYLIAIKFYDRKRQVQYN